MHLSPRDLDKLLLHQAGFLAQKRLARGVKLNLPESVALISTQLLEFVRDGKTVSALMNLGKQLLGRHQVMAGVPELLHEVQIEGTFPDGTKLITVHNPIVRDHGDLALALYGSFLPVPDVAIFSEKTPVESFTPGEVLTHPDAPITLNAGRSTMTLSVKNVGDRPIQVGSHYPFWLVNSALVFDRDKTTEHRLDIPAGTAVRFEPGETKVVTLVVLQPTQAQSTNDKT